MSRDILLVGEALTNRQWSFAAVFPDWNAAGHWLKQANKDGERRVREFVARGGAVYSGEADALSGQTQGGLRAESISAAVPENRGETGPQPLSKAATAHTATLVQQCETPDGSFAEIAIMHSIPRPKERVN
ncbi:hypothetical protein [Terriglobus aquaticus]|uniref:Uncharacterized protein n=1 Tax=Terriglobus aquaticus TaxID=940139 RepID=A0ABW9KGR7_9BACT|nr:hypothetical protein [Terriglobus aquaticus]